MASLLRTGNTKGWQLKRNDPALPTGRACLTCRSRKVKCSGATPACLACMRTARSLHRDPFAVVCRYDKVLPTTEVSQDPMARLEDQMARFEDIVRANLRAHRSRSSSTSSSSSLFPLAPAPFPLFPPPSSFSPITGLPSISIPHQSPFFTRPDLELFETPSYPLPSSPESAYSSSPSSTHNSDSSRVGTHTPPDPFHPPPNPFITYEHANTTLSLPFIFPSTRPPPPRESNVAAASESDAHWAWPWFTEDVTYHWGEHTGTQSEW